MGKGVKCGEGEGRLTVPNGQFEHGSAIAVYLALYRASFCASVKLS